MRPENCDQQRHFVRAGAWDPASPEASPLNYAICVVRGKDTALVVDNTALSRTSNHPGVVVPQNVLAIGKNTSCQSLVAQPLASGKVRAMMDLRSFDLEGRSSCPSRLNRAGVPEEFRVAQTKPQILLSEIDSMAAVSVRFACVETYAGCGPCVRTTRASRGITSLKNPVVRATSMLILLRYNPAGKSGPSAQVLRPGQTFVPSRRRALREVMTIG